MARSSKAKRVRNKKWAQRMLNAFKNRCAYCAGSIRGWTIDHFIPMALGGSHRLENLVPSCRRCNSAKGGEEPVRWMYGAGINVKRFNELREAWCTLIYNTLTPPAVCVTVDTDDIEETDA